MKMKIRTEERSYIQKRLCKSKLQAMWFYLFRLCPIRRNKIVFCCIEGTTGYTCNPKYIAEECISRNLKNTGKYELVWLVNDVSKMFPEGIKVVRNTLLNRAYHLTTAQYWIDNSRKQLEVRKRKGQIYIQTWHAKLGFKPTCLDRGDSFSTIAYMVSKHDSDMIDYVLSNSEWYDRTLPTGMIYSGPTLRTGSPRCDVLINEQDDCKVKVRNKFGLSPQAKIIMYAPTFRGGSQAVNREVEIKQGYIDYKMLCKALEQRFDGKWYVFLRLHPQLVARNIVSADRYDRLVDVSLEDDMYEILAGCDAFLTDYSSAAFDAAVMKIPVFLYCDDYHEYQEERGKLLWDLEKLPFLMAQSNAELECCIKEFDNEKYEKELNQLFEETQMKEDGMASGRVVDFIEGKEWNKDILNINQSIQII